RRRVLQPFVSSTLPRRVHEPTRVGTCLRLLVGNPGWAIDILSCGEMVPAGDVGVLQADLTCSGVGVEVDEMATLQLNGHSITGASPGVFCPHRCTIQGPGELV